MHPYVILTDSAADLPAALRAEYEIEALPLTVTVEGEPTRADGTLDLKQFYDTLRAGRGATTAAVSIEAFLSVMERHLAAGRDILYLGFSSGLSGTYNAGFVAAHELAARYPARRIVTVDTLGASMGEGLLVYLAAKKRAAGADLETVRAFVETNKGRLCHLFVVDDLFFLRRGGRVGTATAVLGSMLAVKPILHVDDAGRLVPVGKARGRRAALAELARRMRENAVDPASQTVFISHCDSAEDAAELADTVRLTVGAAEIVIGDIGAVIGAHSGPGTVALFFIGKER